MKNPIRLIYALYKDIVSAWPFAMGLLVRDIKAQYRQSFLGIFWAFAPPLLSAAALTFAKNNNLINIQTADIPYPAFIAISMCFWQVFQEGINAPLNGINSSKSFLAKVPFPVDAVLIAKIGEIGFNFLPKLFLIGAVIAWYQIPLGTYWFFFIVQVFSIALLGVGIGLLILPLGMLYHDFIKFLPLALNFMLFLTPVFYPFPSQGKWLWLIDMNPLAHVIEFTRQLLLSTSIEFSIDVFMPPVLMLVGVIAMTMVGWIITKISLPFLIERLSN